MPPRDMAEVKTRDSLVQFSLLAALAAGDYGDGAPLGEVLKSGDFGIGTFDRLDGELILLDGEIAWRQHEGGHTTGPNWPTFLTWAERYIGKPRS